MECSVFRIVFSLTLGRGLHNLAVKNLLGFKSVYSRSHFVWLFGINFIIFDNISVLVVLAIRKGGSVQKVLL